MRRKESLIYITHVRLDPASPLAHHHVTDVRWLSPSSAATNHSTLEQVVDWINDGGDAWVREDFANLKVVAVIGAPHYIRAVAMTFSRSTSSSFPAFETKNETDRAGWLMINRRFGTPLVDRAVSPDIAGMSIA